MQWKAQRNYRFALARLGYGGGPDQTAAAGKGGISKSTPKILLSVLEISLAFDWETKNYSKVSRKLKPRFP